MTIFQSVSRQSGTVKQDKTLKKKWMITLNNWISNCLPKLNIWNGILRIEGKHLRSSIYLQIPKCNSKSWRGLPDFFFFVLLAKISQNISWCEKLMVAEWWNKGRPMYSTAFMLSLLHCIALLNGIMEPGQASTCISYKSRLSKPEYNRPQRWYNSI